MSKRRIHDGIVGLVVAGCSLLGLYVNTCWLWVTVILGVLLMSSLVTGFCPLYFLLDKIKGGEPTK